MSFDNFNIITEKIKEKNVKRVLLQLPEGLKPQATEIAEELSKAGCIVFLSGDPCYGACDIAIDDAKKLGCDLLVHIGHTRFYKDILSEVPVLYCPLDIDVEISGIDFSPIKESRIGLVTSIQHLSMIDKVEEILKESGKEVVKGGYILGCWTQNAEAIRDKVDAFLFIGSGKFHPAGMKGNIYVLDLEKSTVEKMPVLDEKRVYSAIFRARNAMKFAILLSSKPGQTSLERSEYIKKQLEASGRKALIIILDEIRNDRLYGMGFDAFINTACPRIGDDYFDRPVINERDFEELMRFYSQ